MILYKFLRMLFLLGIAGPLIMFLTGTYSVYEIIKIKK